MITREGEARELGLLGRDVNILTREGALVRLTERRPYRYRLELPTPRTPGEWIRVYRMQAGLTKDRLVELSGVDRITVNGAEKDKGEPWLVSLYCILRTLGVRLAEHLARVDGHEPPAPLPVKARLSLQDALLNARIAFDVLVASDSPLPRIRTIRRECLRRKVNPIEFWRHVDSLLGELP